MVSARKRKSGGFQPHDKKMSDYKYQSDLRQAMDYKICFFNLRKIATIKPILFI
jgi:hypothetical protein